jgi:hypothetical protein
LQRKIAAANKSILRNNGNQGKVIVRPLGMESEGGVDRRTTQTGAIFTYTAERLE